MKSQRADPTSRTGTRVIDSGTNCGTLVSHFLTTACDQERQNSAEPLPLGAVVAPGSHKLSKLVSTRW